MLEARPPRQHAADVQRLALDLPKHIRRIHALRRTSVVRATRGVNMMVAAIKAVRSGIDPALELDRDLRFSPVGGRAILRSRGIWMRAASPPAST